MALREETKRKNVNSESKMVALGKVLSERQHRKELTSLKAEVMGRTKLTKRVGHPVPMSRVPKKAKNEKDPSRG